MAAWFPPDGSARTIVDGCLDGYAIAPKKLGEVGVMSEYEGFTIKFAGTHKGIAVGKFPDRKKYCLCEMTEPNNLVVLAHFQSAECAVAFERVLDGLYLMNWRSAG